jgi:two-component sensor histidine kinase
LLGQKGHAAQAGIGVRPDGPDTRVLQGEPSAIAPLLQTLSDASLVRLGRLGCRFLAAPCAVLSLLVDGRHLLKGAAGMPPWLEDESHAAALRQLTEQAVEAAAPVTATVAGPPSTAPGPVTCVALPLRLEGQGILGALCVLDQKARTWTEAEQGFLADLAEAAACEVALHLERAARQAAEQALVAERERIELALSAGGMTLWDLDLARGRVSWSEAMPDLLQLRPGRRDESHDALLSLVLDEDRPSLQARREAALAGGEPGYEAEFRISRGDGAVRWLHLKASIRRDAAGIPVSITGAAVDVTERKHAEEQRDVLVRELNHRTKNLLAVVQAIAHQTSVGASSVPAFLKAFDGRLSALGAAQGRLTTKGWHGAGLQELLHQTLLPLGLEDGRRLQVEADDLPLTSAAAQSLALAVHELATNATKHGALSVPEGRATLTARLAAAETGAVLELVWRETDGPPVRPPTRHGFGTALLTRVIKRQHRGRVHLDWNPAGLVCRIVLPADQVLEDDRAVPPAEA